MSANTSRRWFIGAILLGLSGILAGCLENDPPARCSGLSEGNIDGPINHVKMLTGDEKVSLGTLVSADAPIRSEYDAIVVRDRDGGLLADVPLRRNRDKSARP